MLLQAEVSRYSKRRRLKRLKEVLSHWEMQLIRVPGSPPGPVEMQKPELL